MKSPSRILRFVAASAALSLGVLLATTPAHAQFRGGHGSGGGRGSFSGRGFAGGSRFSGGARFYGGGTRYYGGGTRYYGGGTRYYGGGYRYYGGGYRYYPHFYRRPVVRFGIGIGFGPYYDPWYYPVPYPVYEPVPVAQVVVTDAPPDGCYYYDAYCGLRFSSLDAYLDHLDTHNHDAYLEVIDRRSGERVHIYQYSNRNWRVRDDLTRDGDRDDRDNYNRDDRDTHDRDNYNRDDRDTRDRDNTDRDDRSRDDNPNQN